MNESAQEAHNRTWFEHYVVESLGEIKESSRKYGAEFHTFKDEQTRVNSEIKESLAYQKGLNKGRLVLLLLLSGGAGAGLKEVVQLLLSS